MVRRGVVQLLSALLHNANLPGFITGRIWQAQPKSVCVPVLNCYSCPGALGACPIGSLQSTLAGTALKFPFYVVGLLLLFALCLGRVICGWLCPFGLVQDLLYNIPSPKLRKNAFTQKLSLLKYAVAVIFVLLLPVYFWWQTAWAHRRSANTSAPQAHWKQGCRCWHLTQTCVTALGFCLAGSFY